MRSVDDYKMVLHNTAIVINHCTPNDFPTLYRKFTIYDAVCHRVEPLGVYFDPENQRIFFPRGIDVDYVRRKVESNMVEEFTSTVVHNNKYAHVTKPIKMKMLPRGGYLATCSCSHFMRNEDFKKMLLDAARDAGVSLKLIEERRASPDHPVAMSIEETDYLKFFLLQVV